MAVNIEEIAGYARRNAAAAVKTAASSQFPIVLSTKPLIFTL